MKECKTLAGKLVRVRRSMKPVKKTGQSSYLRHQYYTQEDIDNAVRPLLDAEGVVLFTTITGYAYELDGRMVTCQMELVFIDSETGETLSATYYGAGKALDDKGKLDDKGLYAAYTGAYKYGIMKTFGLSETADEAEHDAHNEPGEKTNGIVPAAPAALPAKSEPDKPITKAQYQDLVERFRDNGWKNSTVKAYLASKGYERGTDIRRRDYMAITLDADDVGVRLQYEGNEEVAA